MMFNNCSYNLGNLTIDVVLFTYLFTDDVGIVHVTIGITL